MSTINVNSISALEDLETSLVRFSSEVKDTIESANREIQKKTELLDQIVAERRRAVAQWQSIYDDADDEEDTTLIQKKLAEAEEELREAMKWQRTVEEVCAEYGRHKKQAFYLSDKHSDQARLFLRTRIERLYDYVALKPDSSRHLAPVSGSELSSAASPSEAPAITSLPLPTGFGWIQFDDLMPLEMQDLPAEGDYRKDGLTKTDMQEGLLLLRTRILPEIQKDPTGATLEHFSALDAAEMRSGKNSLANIFAAYFGDSQIRVSRYEGDSYFRIGNGRHRIKAALELGWNAVPGQIVEVPRRADQV